MDIDGFQAVEGVPAVFVSDLDLLAISDLHLGLEGSMTSEGSYVPKFHLEEIMDDIETAKEETEASRILINGDLKNDFQKSYYSEKEEVRKLLNKVREIFEEVIVVKGNHDNFIEETVEDEGIDMREYFLENSILFIHGDKIPEKIVGDDKKYKTVVLGHEHPALSLKDEIGVSEKVDCILYGKTNEDRSLVVLPAFSKISNGTNVNEVPREELLSPFLRENVCVKNLKAVAVSREAGNFEFPELEVI